MQSAPSGYQIETVLAAWNDLRARLIEADPEDAPELADLLNNENSNVDDMLARLIRAVVHSDGLIKLATSRIDDIKHRRERYENRSAGLRGTVLQLMEVTGRRALDLGDVTAYVRPGREAVVITDAALLPAEYVRTKTETMPDKVKIGADLREGVVIDGAMLSNPMPTLTIRTR